MFRETAFGAFDLAPPTKPAAAADRIDVHAEAARRIEYRSAVRKRAAPSGRRENDSCVTRAQQPVLKRRALTGAGAGVRHDYAPHFCRRVRDIS